MAGFEKDIKSYIETGVGRIYYDLTFTSSNGLHSADFRNVASYIFKGKCVDLSIDAVECKAEYMRLFPNVDHEYFFKHHDLHHNADGTRMYVPKQFHKHYPHIGYKYFVRLQTRINFQD